MFVETILPVEVLVPQRRRQPPFEKPDALLERSPVTQGHDEVQVIRHDDPRTNSPNSLCFQANSLRFELPDQLRLVEAGHGAAQFGGHKVLRPGRRPAVAPQCRVPWLSLLIMMHGCASLWEGLYAPTLIPRALSRGVKPIPHPIQGTAVGGALRPGLNPLFRFGLLARRTCNPARLVRPNPS